MRLFWLTVLEGYTVHHGRKAYHASLRKKLASQISPLTGRQESGEGQGETWSVPEQEVGPSYWSSRTSPNDATNRGPCIQTNEPMRVISHSNYHKSIFFRRKVNLKVFKEPHIKDSD